nr:immunoglobulin light chain junction region [Macaca mulatta]MOX48735.1 immunoglobulin light chain junction region [Macaca mulatta]MOX49020.1 immunoglobulin light chain junction region [Macaca mulatta]MOX49428.1 immunoglobulin light chain junction region [Macaca mulatta]MOX51415.1 immunoglobulin light chain junction region [Macaca mulatta]
CHQYSTSPYSF